ncbi:META domain-containing protein [Persicitalea jodogahamensis]|uniref:DUF306 domain-containing protein n=1 Tax=Persicitalea jodogahamensis TaxID=402147 RepID=A0A8J3GC75_9BACT|nr:META domain-containing protein [Persicitalea jodogahamensis]GHB86892.1 hypothetical protein GCM10007390_48330 [Persicitalea jodogahamensis]
MKPYLIALFLAFILMAGCGTNWKNKKLDQLSALSMETDELSKGLIIGRSWRLVELEGEEVARSPNQNSEIKFVLKTDQNRFTGIVGCNTFSGNYRLKWGKAIRFSQIVKTRNDCPEVYALEKGMFNAFGLVDSYIIKGDTLTLLFGEGAPLAKFDTVQLDDTTLAEKN